jgi:hypothetical protein
MKHIKKVQPQQKLSVEPAHNQKQEHKLDLRNNKLEKGPWLSTPVGLKCIPSGNPPDRD